MIIDPIIAVLGGSGTRSVAFVGAIVYVLLQNFAIEPGFGSKRINLVNQVATFLRQTWTWISLHGACSLSAIVRLTGTLAAPAFTKSNRMIATVRLHRR
jgi:ABC-type branched-subunit amino acid transport system permease subunit